MGLNRKDWMRIESKGTRERACAVKGRHLKAVLIISSSAYYRGAVLGAGVEADMGAKGIKDSHIPWDPTTYWGISGGLWVALLTSSCILV